METLLDSPLRLRGALVTDALSSDPRGATLFGRFHSAGTKVEILSASDFASAAATDSPQGVLAIGEIPERRLAPPSEFARYLILDGVQDPGNAGTIIRTAAALGVDYTLALPGTVDLWNAKVVRSTTGAIFGHSALHTTWDEIADFLARHDVQCWGASMGGKPADELLRSEVPSRLALVVGNEGAGISQAVASSVTTSISVRIEPLVESLNVSVATGILLHALRI